MKGITGARARAERLTRYVNALLDKKPTVSLPSAREVLRTKVGDCNEHTALYVAMARAAGIPARIAVGLVFVRGVQGAFYYHAWPEVYLDEGNGRGMWLPVDPTLNQFPADGTHLRLVRGGLDKQAAILPLMGSLRITVVDLDLDPQSTPILVGPEAVAPPPVNVRTRASRRVRVRRMIAIEQLVKRYGAFTAVDGVSLDVKPGRDPRLPRPQRRRQDDDAADDRRTAAADRRPRHRQRPRSRGGARGGKGVAGLHPRSPVHLREAHRR